MNNADEKKIQQSAVFQAMMAWIFFHSMPASLNEPSTATGAKIGEYLLGETRLGAFRGESRFQLCIVSHCDYPLGSPAVDLQRGATGRAGGHASHVAECCRITGNGAVMA